MVSNEGTGTSGSIQYRLQYKESTGGTWTNVPDSTPNLHWQMSASDYINDTGEPTSDIDPGLTNPGGGTFVQGELRDNTAVTSGITLLPARFTEIEYSIEATSDATDGQDYYFRVTRIDGTTDNFTYPVLLDDYPKVTLAAPAATKLVFTVEPSNTQAEDTFVPAIKVEAQDDLGVTDTNYTGDISISILNNPPGDGALSGTTTVAAVSGVATFSDLSIDKVGVGYTLQATSGSLTAATSTSFNITAIKLVFTVQPTNTASDATITPAIEVAAQDNYGNTDTTYTADISIIILNNPLGTGALSGTATVAAVSGVATFSDLSIDKAGVGYTLRANSGSLTQVTSASFNITASKLVFTVQPSNTRAGATITPAIEVAAQDNYGNTDTSYTGNISMAILNNPGSGTLSGTTPVAAVSGVATFSDLSIDNAGAGYLVQYHVGHQAGLHGPAHQYKSGSYHRGDNRGGSGRSGNHGYHLRRGYLHCHPQ
jgi:hypothetical protein